MRSPDKEHRELLEDWVEANPYKAEAYRNAIIEECARVAESISEHFVNHPKEMAEKIAAAIRALKSDTGR